MMNRWALNALGRHNLCLVAAPKPRPAPGEVLVKVSAVSLNYRDKLVIETGARAQLSFPFIPGSDMAGVVEAVGEGVARFGVGDRVISSFVPDWIDGDRAGTARDPGYRSLGGAYPGVLAEYVACPAHWLVAAPASLDDAEASTLPVAGLTAWFALVEQGGVSADQTILVQGTGGVALFGLLIARAYGARVIITSSSDDKLARARALGAAYGINRTTDDWVEGVYRATDDRGADHILELVGGRNLERSLRAVAIHGRISIIGLLDGAEISAPTGLILQKSPILQGVSVGHRRALEDFCRMIDQTGLKPVIDTRHAFADLPAALARLDEGPFGKIVVEVG